LTWFRWIIPVFAGFACLVGFAKFRRWANPVSVLVLWWCLWLFVANFSPTGVYVPSPRTQILVLVMLYSLVLGSFFAVGTLKGETGSVPDYNRRLRKRWRAVFWIAVGSMPVVAYYFVKAIGIFLSEGFLGYRGAVFGDMDRPSVLFGSNYVELLYTIVLSPLIFLALLAGVVYYLVFRDRWMLGVSLLLTSMDAIMRLGRFNFYYLLFFLFLSILLLMQRSRSRDGIGLFFAGALRNARGAIVTLVVAMAIILMVLNTVRMEEAGTVTGVLGKFAIEYHTGGFVLFDDSLNHPASELNRHMSYGRSLFGGLDTLAVLVLRRMDSGLQSISNVNGPLMREFQVVGYDSNGYPIMANAFYTVLYTMYQDGREFAFFVVPFLFGYFLSNRYLDWLRGGDIGTLMLLNVLLFAGFFSLFMSPVEGVIFWVSLALLFLINRVWLPVRFVSAGGEP